MFYVCPMCGGNATVMGSLGDLLWFCCQDCGMRFNKKVDPETDVAELCEEEE